MFGVSWGRRRYRCGGRDWWRGLVGRGRRWCWG